MSQKSIILFSKAQGSAIVGTIADFAMALICSEIVGLWYAISNALGLITGGITNCCINYRFVFRSHADKRAIGVRYSLVWILSFALNYFGTYYLTELLPIHFIIPKCCTAICVAFFVNYPLQNKFVFR